LYKKDNAVLKELCRAIEGLLSDFNRIRGPMDDDELDAYVAYLPGKKWLANSGVTLLGSNYWILSCSRDPEIGKKRSPRMSHHSPFEPDSKDPPPFQNQEPSPPEPKFCHG
jgi:hypothetical protein